MNTAQPRRRPLVGCAVENNILRLVTCIISLPVPSVDRSLLALKQQSITAVSRSPISLASHRIILTFLPLAVEFLPFYFIIVSMGKYYFAWSLVAMVFSSPTLSFLIANPRYISKYLGMIAFFPRMVVAHCLLTS